VYIISKGFKEALKPPSVYRRSERSFAQTPQHITTCRSLFIRRSHGVENQH